MTRKCCILLFAAGVIFCQTACTETWPPQRLVEIDFTVVDDDGHPVADSRIRLTSRYIRGGETVRDNYEIYTDESGVAKFRRRTAADLFIGARKEGYYVTSLGSIGRGGYGIDPASKEPISKSIKMTLRKIQNPIAMYGYGWSFPLPEENREIGFDLLGGDWVRPYGTGRTADFSVVFSRERLGGFDFRSTTKILFPNPGDGYLVSKSVYPESQFKTPREADAEGYQSELTIERNRIDDEYQWETQATAPVMILRTRTEYSDDGSIESAHYSILPSGIEPIGQLAEKPAVRFHYWFNPTPNDRNLEFDPERNLADEGGVD